MGCKGFCKRHIHFLSTKAKRGDDLAICSACVVTFKGHEYKLCPCCHTILHRGLGFNYTLTKGHEPELRLKPVEQDLLDFGPFSNSS